MYAIVIDDRRKKEYEFTDECVFDDFRIVRNTIILNEKFYFKSGTLEALPDHLYVISNGLKDIHLFLYSDSIGISDFHICERKDMTISADNNADIVNLDPFYRDNILRLEKNSAVSNSCFIFINNIPYLGQEIKNGDFLEILGLKCYLYENFIYLNSFRNSCHLKEIKLDEKILKLKIQRPVLTNFHEGEQAEFKIKKLNRFTHPVWNKRSLISQIGPAITMALTLCAISSINIYSNYLMNGFSLTMVAMGLMPLTIILSGVVWPFIINHLEKKNYDRNYNIARDSYIKYLNEYRNEIVNSIAAELKYVSQYVFNPEDITSKLFYVTLNNNHFLSLYLGRYNRCLDFEYEDTQDEEINKILKSVKYHLNNINDYPLYLDLKKYSRITVKTRDRINTMKEVLLQLAYKHHYNDLFIVIFCKDDRVFEDFLNLPHLFNDERRYTLTSERDLAKINSLKTVRETVVLLCDYSDVLFNGSDVHAIYFTEDDKLLKDCDAYIDYTGILSSLVCVKRQDFIHESINLDYRSYFEYISRTRELTKSQSISFKNIFTREDILSNYTHSANGLKATFAFNGSEILDFDLHETKDGPHGLIGGATGSGKSELIISMLMSLALRYSPEYLNMIIVDYKGAGLTESLTYKDRTLPHIIASLSNLDEAGFERLSIAIGRICTSRQQLFKELSKKCQISIMSIDDYLQNCEAYGFEKMAHLLIVVDEFAELKKTYPDSISRLISFSRIGRSLGLHLILATQKPSGVVDEEIWSNSHFKIALKLNSEKDSRDIIKKDDAAYLSKPGDFYLLVDDCLTKGHSIYAKKDI
ncbi:MAG: FtsK/SpoIIIE domain-containing protein, partial [Erysipelotrichaceae bacterium]